METLIIILAILAGIIGVAGSILPGLPGLPLGWVGLLILYIWGDGNNASGDTIGLLALILWGVVVAIVTVVDYIVPPLIIKKMGGSKYAERGALVGMIVGIFLTPIGMIIGAYLGALLAELFIAKKSDEEAAKSAFGTFVGFILGTGIKTIVAVCILISIIKNIFW